MSKIANRLAKLSRLVKSGELGVGFGFITPIAGRVNRFKLVYILSNGKRGELRYPSLKAAKAGYSELLKKYPHKKGASATLIIDDISESAERSAEK